MKTLHPWLLLCCLITWSISCAQNLQSLSREQIEKLKIKSIACRACEDSTCKTTKPFLQWDFDRKGNLTKEFLGDDEDTSYLYYYRYGKRNELIEMIHHGDFLCYSIDNSVKPGTTTKYFYDTKLQLLKEERAGGCCQLTVNYHYNSNGQLMYKAFDNRGCRYNREIDTLFFEFSSDNKEKKEWNKHTNILRMYYYNSEGLISQEEERALDNPELLYDRRKYIYSKSNLIQEIDGHSIDGKPETMEEQIDNYQYKDALFDRYFQTGNGPPMIYVYEYY